MCTMCLSEKGVGFPETGVTDGYEPPCEYWELNAGSVAGAASSLSHGCVSLVPPMYFQDIVTVWLLIALWIWVIFSLEEWLSNPGG